MATGMAALLGARGRASGRVCRRAGLALAVGLGLMLGAGGAAAQVPETDAERPAGAERCTPVPPPAATRADLLARLKAAETEAEGRALGDVLRHLWAVAPDERAGALLARVFERRRSYDFEAAEDAARALTVYCPGFAEGWNQLATVLFERERFDASLDTIPRVLELEPAHFGALAGRAIILMRQGRMQLGQAALREALAIHPWLSERVLLIEIPGEDL